ncbi:UbiA prenyltransferase [Melanogaster broomeanus]|nr:UbiA prenyltransferase [Melanogaster broomeanus]
MTEKPQTFVSKSPPKWQLYMQLCRLDDFPLGTAFVFWPSAWAATLAAYRYATAFDVLVLHVLTLFGLCTLLHCAGCVVNNILDVDYDRQVERTKSRPLPSGSISMRSAVALLVALVMGSLLFLILASPDPLAFRVGLFSIVLFTLYPLMKRWTNWPQAWLGKSSRHQLPSCMTMNCSIFVGWTIIYDTIYACLDKHDDAKAGVGSTALYFGPRIRPALSLFSLMFIASLTYAGVVNDQTAIYFVVSVGGAGLHLLWQLATVDFESHKDCFDKVFSNVTLGFIIWLGLVLDYVAKS